MRIAGFESANTNETVFINIDKLVGFERSGDDEITLIYCQGSIAFEVVQRPDDIIQTLANLSN